MSFISNVQNVIDNNLPAVSAGASSAFDAIRTSSFSSAMLSGLYSLEKTASKAFDRLPGLSQTSNDVLSALDNFGIDKNTLFSLGNPGVLRGFANNTATNTAQSAYRTFTDPKFVERLGTEMIARTVWNGISNAVSQSNSAQAEEAKRDAEKDAEEARQARLRAEYEARMAQNARDAASFEESRKNLYGSDSKIVRREHDISKYFA